LAVDALFAGGWLAITSVRLTLIAWAASISSIGS
jgi:hypothetical protein